MTSAIDKDDFNFENSKYRPEFSFPRTASQVQAGRMENRMKINTLANRAVPVPSMTVDPNHSVYVMDTCIRVKIPSDTFRQEKVKHWEEKHSTVKTWGWIEGGVAVLLGGTGAGAAFLQLNPYAVGALAVAFVASMVFCYLNVTKTHEASRQIEGWQASPLEKIAKDRAKAYQEGFPYVYRKDLKLQGLSHTQILLPYEVHFLFERHFDQFYTNLLPQHPQTEQGKKEWLDHFTSCNPMDGNVLRYAHKGAVPEKYARVSYDYDVLNKQLHDMRGAFNTLRNERREESNKIIQGINQNRNLALLPFQGMLTYWELQAKTERDTKLFKTTDPQEIEKIKDEYSSAVKKYHLYHTAAIIPVNLVFDKQVSDAKDALKKIIDEIKKNEASSHAPYFNYAWGLLDYARQVKQVPAYVYQPQPLSPAQVFDIPAPFAPPVININFVQQAQEQRPKEIDDSNYADYLRFISGQQQAG